MTKNVALFGSSFDPPTGKTGHGGIVAHLASMFDEVWLLPVYQHPFTSKRSRVLSTGFETRVEMLKLQFGQVENVKVDQSEKLFFEERQRRGLKGEELVFGTMDLIEYLREIHQNCNFTFVLGGDTLNDLLNGKWRRCEEFMDSVPVVAIKRAGVEVGFTEEEIKSTFKARARLIEIPGLSDVSSSQVRKRLSEGEDVSSGMVDDSVLQFILQNGLYGSKL